MKATTTAAAQRQGSLIGPPDFVGVGAQRAGTKWWFGLIADHPEVQIAGGKELHFFERYLDRDFDESDVLAYHRMFPRPEGIATGEWTPRYMHDFWTPALLRRAAPEAKILVLLRDPWERYRSGLGHEARVLGRALSRKRSHYVHALMVNDALNRSLYRRQLSRLLEHFEGSQVLVLQYERCVSDPARELRRTYEFLGLADLDHRPAFLTGHTGRASPRTPIAAGLERSARDAMARDALELAQLLPEIDLELWPSCREP